MAVCGVCQCRVVWCSMMSGGGVVWCGGVLCSVWQTNRQLPAPFLCRQNTHTLNRHDRSFIDQGTELKWQSVVQTPEHL